MSKTWDTKKKILKLLSKQNLNLTEISHMLNLAPSTVSKHIEELKRVGAISHVENPYIKKWKYYAATPNFNTEGVIRGNFSPIENRFVRFGITAGVIVIGLMALYWFYASQQPHILSFQLTDPPQVPVGTQALILNYSSLKAHYVGSGNVSGWVPVGSAGSVNLMALVNVSEMIGSAAIPASAVVNEINLTVSSVRIELNGTDENVTVPNNRLLVNVNGTVQAASSGSEILIDLSPTIVSIFTQNTTVFVMVPSVRAVLVGPHTTEMVGATEKLNTSEQKVLQATPMINISSASITTSSQNSTLYVTVTNYGNTNATINRILLYGNFSILALLNASPTNLAAGMYTTRYPAIETPPNASVSTISTTSPEAAQTSGISGNTGSTPLANASAVPETGNNYASGAIKSNETITANATAEPLSPNILLNTTKKHAGTVLSIIDGIHVETNASVNSSAGAATDSSIAASKILSVGVSISHLQMLDFEIGVSGKLSLASSAQGFSTGGYVMHAHSSTVFIFSGEFLEANGHIVVSPVSNSTYRMVVEGGNISISATVRAQGS